MATPADKRLHQLTLAIQKAINAIETPVKEKHVRSAIIGTFQEQSAITYWMVAIRLPLQDNRIVAWKFCHVTHKLLREGHPACLDDSQRHIEMIENLGRLWVHLREGYGRLVHLYCNLLVCKLKFHARNPRFPGNMMLTADELDAIAENDVNNYFQLCVELFDYMDEILSLQATVFESLGNARANSMTASGQCRLAALIPCAQDASHIYDCNVRLLFRLHASLPPDTLSGHRDRFRQQFRKLSSFYKHASSLQYYRNLLTLPVLPSNPPNFLLQSDFGTYVTPVVSIPEQPPDEVDTIGSLIDTSDTISQATTPDQLDISESRTTPSPQPDPVVERDRLIEHLQNELKRMRSEVSQLVQERSTMMGSMREHCTRLETQLHTTKTELEEERQKAEILSSQAPQMKQKLTETAEKAKVTDEKFQKLKGAYTQLREEHINLIRQKAEVDKMTATLRSTAAQHESAKMALQQQLNDRIKDVELLQQSASSSEEIEAYKSELTNLRSDLEQSRQKEIELETLRANMESLEIEHKTAMKEQEEKLNTVTTELKEATETLASMKLQKEENENELNKVKEELSGLRDKSGQEYKRVLDEKEIALKQVAELTQQYQQDKEEQVQCIEKLQGEIENLQEKLSNTESKYIFQYKEIEEELNSRSQEFSHDLEEKDAQIKQALEQLETLQLEMDKIQADFTKKCEEQTLMINEYENKTKDLSHTLEESIGTKKELEQERDELRLQFNSLSQEKLKLDSLISEKNTQVLELQQKTEHLMKQSTQQLEDYKNSIGELRQQIQTISLEKDNELTNLQITLEEKTEYVNQLKTENDSLTKAVSDLETKINDKNVEIEVILAKLNDATSHIENQKNVLEGQQKESQYEVSLLKDKLQNIIESKDEIISNFKNMLAEKDAQVVNLNVEVKKQVHEIFTLKEELEETRAELEIGQNELISLKDEHDAIIERNERNLLLKNQELRNLNEQVTNLTQEKSELIKENEKLTNDFMIEKQILDNKIKDLEVRCESLKSDYNNVQIEKKYLLDKTQVEVENLKTDLNKLRESKEEEIKLLKEKIQERDINLNTLLSEKMEIITEKSQELEKLKAILEELKLEKAKEKECMETIISNNERENQILEAKFDHTQREKLNVECELQDLLQHNTVLEADVASLRRQLEDAQKEIENQRSKLVSSATESALEMTNEALAALERSNAQDSNRMAAELAANALKELATKSQIKGNEEAVSRSVMVAAHTTAQLSAYVAELSNIATDLDQADKLNSASRNMLQSTKQCWESVAAGNLEVAKCAAARGLVEAASRAAAAADRAGSGARSVDDELADMDAAIEEAASQIEELLAASRAGDSGVKLEVNSKILDACTTLMGAVKILVQDSRKLQNELGDTKTRQKMYRKNPQWSEGLISAAKAVVFAAKLLVTSADEAVGSAGRVEGVSAAAHEVAGSTAQLVAASRARAPPASPGLARLTTASRAVAAATGALVAAVRAAAALTHEQEALDTSALTLTATRRLEMESKVRSLELETALDAERARLAALRKRHYQLAQQEENGNMTNGKQ